jgi:hypothetical protein
MSTALKNGARKIFADAAVAILVVFLSVTRFRISTRASRRREAYFCGRKRDGAIRGGIRGSVWVALNRF